MTSIHYSTARQTREALIQSIGYGTLLGSCVVDKNHPNGKEIHFISSTGIIVIYNFHSHKKVTTLIAHPAQLTRYGLPIPQQTLNLAYEHMMKGYNLI